MTVDPDVLNNPIVTRARSANSLDVRVLSEEALEVFRLAPVKTVWGWEEGAPNYDRLPAWSQAYKKGYDRDQAYVYYDHRKNPRFFGPNTLQVTVNTKDAKLLEVESGSITWYGGQSEVEKTVVDVSTYDNTIPLQDGRYQVGYILGLEPFETDTPVEGYSLIDVDEQLLSTAAVYHKSSSEIVYHEDYQAITEFSTESWVPRRDFNIQDYYPGAQYFFDFRTPVVANRFLINSDQNYGGSSKLAVYWSDDNIYWEKDDEVTALSGKWEALISSTKPHRYWQFLFWDGDVSVSEILYSGEALYPDLRVSGPTPTAELYVTDLYEAPEADDHIVLANFDVKNGRVTKVLDQRKSTPYKYEPVAEWLSSPSDIQLRCLFKDVEAYHDRYLSPVEGHYKFYYEMENFMCTNQGEIDLSGDVPHPLISFPEILELWDTFAGATKIEPPQIDILADPIGPSDVSNKRHTDYMLYDSWTIDNGFY